MHAWRHRLKGRRAEWLDRGDPIRLVGGSSRAAMQRTEALSILRLKALPSTRQELYQAIQSTNPQLDGWGA